jgi:hypothetical protein
VTDLAQRYQAHPNLLLKEAASERSSTTPIHAFDHVCGSLQRRCSAYLGGPILLPNDTMG